MSFHAPAHSQSTCMLATCVFHASSTQRWRQVGHATLAHTKARCVSSQRSSTDAPPCCRTDSEREVIRVHPHDSQSRISGFEKNARRSGDTKVRSLAARLHSSVSNALPYFLSSRALLLLYRQSESVHQRKSWTAAHFCALSFWWGRAKHSSVKAAGDIRVMTDGHECAHQMVLWNGFWSLGSASTSQQ